MAVRRGPLPRKPTANTHRTDPVRSTSEALGGSARDNAPRRASESPASRFPFPVAAPVAARLRAAGGRLRPALGGLLLLRKNRGVCCSALCEPGEHELPFAGLQRPEQVAAREQREWHLGLGKRPAAGHGAPALRLRVVVVVVRNANAHRATVARAPCQYKDKSPSAPAATCRGTKSLSFYKRGRAA